MIFGFTVLFFVILEFQTKKALRAFLLRINVPHLGKMYITWHYAGHEFWELTEHI